MAYKGLEAACIENSLFRMERDAQSSSSRRCSQPSVAARHAPCHGGRRAATGRGCVSLPAQVFDPLTAPRLGGFGQKLVGSDTTSTFRRSSRCSAAAKPSRGAPLNRHMTSPTASSASRVSKASSLAWGFGAPEICEGAHIWCRRNRAKVPVLVPSNAEICRQMPRNGYKNGHKTAKSGKF